MRRTSLPFESSAIDERPPERRRSLLPALVALLPMLAVASTAVSLIGLR